MYQKEIEFTNAKSINIENLKSIPYDTLLRHFALAIEETYKIPVIQLTVFLYSLYQLINNNTAFKYINDWSSCTKLNIDWPPGDIEKEPGLNHTKDFCEMALLKTHPKNWYKRLSYESSLIHKAVPSLPILEEYHVKKIIDRFTLKDVKSDSKNEPILFTSLSEYTLIYDLIFARDFLPNLFLSINLAERVGERGDNISDTIGVWLEQQAAIFFERELSLNRNEMLVGTVIGDNKREVDLAFVFGKVLFVIECKAKVKDEEFIEGKYEKIRNRLKVFFKELLKKNRERIELIRQGVVENIIHPSNFDKEYSLVCTSAVEYLPLNDNHYWINGMPTVGPPEELLNTIKGVVGKENG